MINFQYYRKVLYFCQKTERRFCRSTQLIRLLMDRYLDFQDYRL